MVDVQQQVAQYVVVTRRKSRYTDRDDATFVGAGHGCGWHAVMVSQHPVTGAVSLPGAGRMMWRGTKHTVTTIHFE